jgi:hypothetical protein
MGYILRSLGDVDGDGYDDMAFGADAAQGGGTSIGAGTTGSGEVFMVFGRANAGWTSLVDASGNFNLDNMSNANRTVRFIGRSAGDYLGEGFNAIGDINNDGYADFVIGAPNRDSNGTDAGEGTLIFGRPATGANSWASFVDGSGNFDLDNATAANYMMRFTGRSAGDQLSVMTEPLGDVNGDGYNDFIFGAWLAEGGGADSGETYIFFGRNTKDWWSYPTSGTFSLNNLGLP